MENIILFKDKKDCCGCGNCVNCCPQKAIKMEKDEYGFLYPKINFEKCIHCGNCKNVCAYQKDKKFNNENIINFVGASQNDELLKKSSSGGIFASIAKEFLNYNGIVYGCSLEKEDEKLSPRHIRIDKSEDLIKLQGSKYVQSKLNDIFKYVKEDLKISKKVLFSGTPCQVDALNTFLKNDDNLIKNLYTIDIICHGTPGIEFFQDYIKMLEKNLNAKVVDFCFRDKSEGWKLLGKVKYINKNGKIKEKIILPDFSSYYNLFLSGEIYRKNCYTCKYASNNRISDLTIGDYWGIEKMYPEYLLQNGGKLDIYKGVSCIIVNSKKGEKLIEEFGKNISFNISTFENISTNNKQLKHPTKEGKNRKEILNLYRDYGYEGVEKWFWNKKGIKKYFIKLYEMLPRKVQLIIKK